jgi:hypothetical protein
MFGDLPLTWYRISRCPAAIIQRLSNRPQSPATHRKQHTPTTAYTEKAISESVKLHCGLFCRSAGHRATPNFLPHPAGPGGAYRTSNDSGRTTCKPGAVQALTDRNAVCNMCDLKIHRCSEGWRIVTLGLHHLGSPYDSPLARTTVLSRARPRLERACAGIDSRSQSTLQYILAATNCVSDSVARQTLFWHSLRQHRELRGS